MSIHTFTTTACRNCGYKTRKHKRDVPKLDLFCPVSFCPKCRNLIIDPINAEYEFMTDGEKEKFTAQNVQKWGYITSVLYFILAIGVLILFLAFSGGMFEKVVGLLLGGFGLAYSILSLFANLETKKEETIEQTIYESLQRTSNQDYVDFLNRFGERKYIPFKDREMFMEKYKYFDGKEDYKQEMDKFILLMETIEKEINSSEGGFLGTIFRTTFP